MSPSCKIGLARVLCARGKPATVYPLVIGVIVKIAYTLHLPAKNPLFTNQLFFVNFRFFLQQFWVTNQNYFYYSSGHSL